jgi:hypothetical protein
MDGRLDVQKVIDNRLARIQWKRFVWDVEAIHNRRRMFGGYAYLYGRGGDSATACSYYVQPGMVCRSGA